MTRGETNIAWIEEHCYIPEGRLVGQPVKLTSEQKDWIKQIYDSPTRTFILSMGRKNAKTGTSAFLLLLHIVGPEAEPNSGLYSAAQSRDQAAILFGLAAKVVRMSPELIDFVQIRDTAKELLCPELGTFYKALSADASTKFGLSPAMIVHDELGQVKGPHSELYEALETASAAHHSPLSIIISTQAPTDGDLLSILIDDALAGADPEVKVRLYTAPVDDEPFIEETIKKANPHFDKFMNQKEVMRQAAEAERMPSRENSYRNLILNQRVDITTPFVSVGVWKQNALEPDPLSGVVRGGLDLSGRTDLTSLVLTQEIDDYVNVWPFFWAPEDGVKERSKRDRVPYDIWANQGFLRLTPGKTVDYEFVALDIAAILKKCEIESIAYDRWRMDILAKELDRAEVNIPLLPFGQGFKDMSPALDSLESDLLNSRLRHGMHPVLTMCAANAVTDRDPADNRKLNKAKASGRIDGMVALTMSRGAEVEEAPEYQVIIL